MATEAPPTAEQSSESGPTQAFTYSSSMFFWAMFAVAWSAFAHPFSHTWIDLETGEMRHYTREQKDVA